MSNIDTGNTTLVSGPEAITHSAVPYVAGSTRALAGQRLDVVFWKTGKDGVKRDSMCVSVPPVVDADITANMVALLPHFRTYLEGVQHEIIKDRLTAGALHITQDEISIAACIARLTPAASETPAHLTKESIGAWFDSTLADSLLVALADKLGVGDAPTDEQVAKLDTAVAMYREKVAALAGGKTSYGIPLARSIKNALALAPSGDAIAVRFTARCDKMITDAAEMEFAL